MKTLISKLRNLHKHHNSLKINNNETTLEQALLYAVNHTHKNFSNDRINEIRFGEVIDREGNQRLNSNEETK